MENSKLKCFMPNICWHKDGASDVFAIISIDIQQKSLPPIASIEETNNDDSVIEIDAEEGCKSPGAVYKIVTTNNQEARIWEFHFEPDKKPDVDFLADIRTGQASMNVVRFSPNGELLAIGDVEGTVLVYKLLGKATSVNPPPTVARNVADGHIEESTLPPNKENWARAFVYKHEYVAGVQEVTGICFSPDSLMVASASMDRTLLCYGTGNRKRLWCVKGFRYIVKGIAWDPRGKYIVTLSTSRYFDVLDTKKGTRLRSCYQVDLPETLVDERMKILQKAYKLFYDDQLVSFTLGVDWSPCGSILVTPAAHLDLEEGDLDGCYAFKREDLADCKPTALFPTRKAARMVKFSPVIYKLRSDGDCNFLGLPHRVVWAVMCKTSVLLYDSQHAFPFSHIDNIHVLDLTHIAWTPDGKVLVISSEEGYNTFITIDADVLGEVLDPAATIPAAFVDAENAPDSPKLKRVVKKKPKPPPEPLATIGPAVDGGEIIVQLQGDGKPTDGGAAMP